MKDGCVSTTKMGYHGWERVVKKSSTYAVGRGRPLKARQKSMDTSTNTGRGKEKGSNSEIDKMRQSAHECGEWKGKREVHGDLKARNVRRTRLSRSRRFLPPRAAPSTRIAPSPILKQNSRLLIYIRETPFFRQIAMVFSSILVVVGTCAPPSVVPP